MAQEEKETLNGELQDLVKEKARLELNIKDMKKEVEDDSNARVSRYKVLHSPHFYHIFPLCGLDHSAAYLHVWRL